LKAREFNKRIGFWQTVAVSDGYGGSTVSEALVATSWAKVTTPKSSQRLTELGITDPINTLVINVRKRNDIDYNAVNQYIKYRSVKYIIQNVPINTEFMDTDIMIIAKRQITDSVTEL